MQTGLDPIQTRPESLADIVYESIREGIITRKLAPGSPVTEAALSQQLQVSKTPVREAILKLTHIGLIESAGERRPARVVLPSVEALRAAYEVRVALEVEAVRLVADRGSSSAKAEIRERAQVSLVAAEAHDAVEFRKHDRALHLAIAASTNNPSLEQFLEDAYDLTWTLRLRDVPTASDSVECGLHHVEIAAEIDRADPERAEHAMRRHIKKVQELVVASFDEAEDAEMEPTASQRP